MQVDDHIKFLTANIENAASKEYLRPVLAQSLAAIDVDKTDIASALDRFFGQRTIQ